MRFVDGDGVAVVEVPVGEVFAVEADAAAVEEADVDGVEAEVDGFDGAHHPVVDPAVAALVEVVLPAVVAGQQHPVAGLEVEVVELQHRPVEEAVGGGVGTAVAVQCFGFAAGAGEQDGVSAGAERSPPVADGGGVDVVDVVVEDDSAVGLVGGEGGGDVAVA